MRGLGVDVPRTIRRVAVDDAVVVRMGQRLGKLADQPAGGLGPAARLQFLALGQRLRALERGDGRVRALDFGPRRIELDPVVEQYLVERAYPGNVRELRHTVQRLVGRWPGAGAGICSS